MRIAVVGAGVAGLVAARALVDEHDVAVFEAGPRPGGHVHTVPVTIGVRELHVDCGFIVLNDRNYPRLTALLDELGVTRRPTRMGFSVSAEHEDFEYAGTPAGLFCQPANALRPRFHRMTADLLRFNRELERLLGEPAGDPTLGAFLDEGRYSTWFRERLIGAQACALWSTDPHTIWQLPVRFLARFFDEHGFLRFGGRPRWSTIVGGSATYVDALTAPWGARLRCSARVRRVERLPDGVRIVVDGREPEYFDAVVLACHADEALALLCDATEAEREILGAFAYQANEVVLHSDERLLPRRRAARQAWNYRLVAEPAGRATVTYSANRLQGFDVPVELCVSVNLTDRIDPARIIDVWSCAHPVFTRAAIAAQARRDEIDGRDRTHFAGAYWGFGFHEDGVASALQTVSRLRTEVLV